MDKDWYEVSGLRRDGRKADELRAFSISLGEPLVDGAAWFQCGLTVVLAHCVGPSESRDRSDVATVRCEGPESSAVKLALEAAILLDMFPRTQILVRLHVLADHGSRLACCVNAASLAVVDAGIPMRDCLAAASASLVDGDIFFDPTRAEERAPRLTVAVLPRQPSLVLVQLDGDVLDFAHLERLLRRTQDAALLAASHLTRLLKDHTARALVLLE